MHKNFRPIIVVSVTNNERHGVVRSTVSMAIVFNESRSSKSLTTSRGKRFSPFLGVHYRKFYIIYFIFGQNRLFFFFFLGGGRKKRCGGVSPRAPCRFPLLLLRLPTQQTPEFGGGGKKREGGVKREPPATWTQPHT